MTGSSFFTDSLFPHDLHFISNIRIFLFLFAGQRKFRNVLPDNGEKVSMDKDGVNGRRIY